MMSTKQITPKGNEATFMQSIRESWASIDAHSWPATIMFLLLIGIEATVNVIVSIPDFGLAISIGVGLLFGFFLGGWHIISERPRNSIKQQSTVEFLVRFIGGASIALILINLLRLNGQVVLTNVSFLPSGASFGFFDYVAIAIIGISFAVHLFGYLTWHNADDGRLTRQRNSRILAKLDQAEQKSEFALRKAGVQLQALNAALETDTELREKFKGLPADQLNAICLKAQQEVYAAYESTYGLDLDDSGMIGDKPKSSAFSPISTTSPSTTSPSTTSPSTTSPSTTAITSLTQLLSEWNMTKQEALDILKSLGLDTDANKAYDLMRRQNYLPAMMKFTDFELIYNELITPVTVNPH